MAVRLFVHSFWKESCCHSFFKLGKCMDDCKSQGEMVVVPDVACKICQPVTAGILSECLGKLEKLDKEGGEAEELAEAATPAEFPDVKGFNLYAVIPS